MCICVFVYLFVYLSPESRWVQQWQMQGAGWTNRGDVRVNWSRAFSTPDCRLRAPFYPPSPPICEILTSWQIGNDGSTNPTIRKIWQESNCGICTIHSFKRQRGLEWIVAKKNSELTQFCPISEKYLGSDSHYVCWAVDLTVATSNLITVEI